MSLSVDKALRQAQSHLKAGELAEAEVLYKQVLSKFPKNKKAIQGYHKLKAGITSNKPVKSEPPQEQIDELIELYNQNDFESVLSKVKPMIGLHPKAIVLFNIQGASNAALQKYDEAIANYKQAIKIKPDYAEAHNNIGSALTNKGDLDAAINSYRQAIKIEPDHAEAYNNMGNIFSGKGESDFAIESYKQALKINPEYADAYSNLGLALKYRGDLDEAIDNFKQALKIKPDYAETYNNMGVALKEKGELDAAIDSYKQALKIKPDYAEAYSNMGNALQDKGNLDAAIGSHKQALKIKPDYAEVYSNLGNALKEKGELDEAIDNFKQAIKIKPDYAEAYNNMGLALNYKGELDAAIDSYKQALKIQPKFAEAHSNMGAALQDKGDLDASISSYNQAIKIKPDYAEAHHNMGVSLKDKGDLEAAIDNYKKALQINPEHADCFINCNSILVQVSDAFSLDGKLKLNASKRLKSLLCENPKYQIQQSIQFFLRGDCEASKNNFINYKTLDEAGKVKDLVKQDQVFCSAYASFINHIIYKCPTLQSFSKNKIYHVGESHCLSYAHHSFTIEEQTFCVSPKITFGAKAYHFSKPKENLFKSFTRRNLDAFPRNSLVFISIGEIDCRINEGLIQASKKNRISLLQLVQETVTGYLDWFLDANVSNNHKFTIFNVPAPCYKQEFSLNANQDAAKVVRLFNETLKINLEDSSCALIDVYGPTKAANGLSNGLYHCDSVHLDCSILNIIQDQITKCEIL